VERLERIYLMEKLLRSRRVVPADLFISRLEVSRATFKRDLEFLRSRINVPVVWDADAGGYRIDSDLPESELPGLWFNAEEALALLTMHQLLGEIGEGMLEPHVAPIARRLEKILGSRGHAAGQVRDRIRLLQMARRPVNAAQFGMLAQALLERRRLLVRHFNRGTGDTLERVLSPQRLVYYRDNWYLDAWCHLREGVRSFAVDAIQQASQLQESSVDVASDELDRELATGYGIFAGSNVRWADLRFSASRARWVSSEQWHPAQRSRVESDGSYRLELPFSDSRELLMDILKHGGEVEVLAPQSLRDEVARHLAQALARYGPSSGGGSSAEPGPP
jgi:predicted DNA-binding transcriptional regulator YafY